MTARHRSVGEVMTRDVVTVRSDTPFKEITAVLADRGVSAAPVVDERGTPVGVVSEADLLRKEVHRPGRFGEEAAPAAWAPERDKARAETAAGLMTAPAATARTDWSVTEAARVMDHDGVKRLPVVDEADHVVGIVSRSDLLKVFLRTDRAIHDEIVEEVLKDILRLDERDIPVHVKDGVVTLRGEVDHRSVARIAERLVERVDGVVAVRPLIDYRSDDLGGSSPLEPRIAGAERRDD